jgi:hypothetical protein
VEASRALSAAARPDVFIAEPVGSCTDLVATVSYPLRRMYGDEFTIAPLSVLLDPVRALRVFGLDSGGSFSEKVLYIYHKQLEEADLIVISKADLLDAARLERLRQAIRERYPAAEVMSVSARHGWELEPWFERITRGEQCPRAIMQVDYDIYAEGEALLGWLNATARVSADPAFDAEAFLQRLAREIERGLSGVSAPIAHLKMTLSPDDGLGSIAVVNLVRNDFVPELSMRVEGPVRSGELIINVRAEASPDLLATAVGSGLRAMEDEFEGFRAELEHVEQFRPGRPTPTYREGPLPSGDVRREREG